MLGWHPHPTARPRVPVSPARASQADSLPVQAIAGYGALLALAWAISEDRRAIRWRTVLAGVALQGALALLLIGFAPAQRAVLLLNHAADALLIRLGHLPDGAVRVDLVGVNSVLGRASRPVNAAPPEVRVHVSALCGDDEIAQEVEDEVYALTICGPSGGGSVRSERRPRLDIVDGYIDRTLVPTALEWAAS